MLTTHIMPRYTKMIEQIKKYPQEYEVGDRIELLLEDRLFKVSAVGVVEEVVSC